MITNAASVSISSGIGSIPNVQSALEGWFQTMTVKIVTKTISDFNVSETTVDKTIQAVRQPLRAKDLMVKPEGQRSWRWEKLHTPTNEEFNLDDVIIFSGTRFRIMAKMFWPEYGYFEYDLAQEFTS